MDKSDAPNEGLSEDSALPVKDFFTSSDESNFPVFWSPSENCFFIEPERNSHVPEDAVEVERTRHQELIGNQTGLTRIISDDDGYPIVTKKHSPTPVLIDQQKIIVENWRKSLMREEVTIYGVTIRPESSDQTSLTNMLTGAQFTGQDKFDFKHGNTWTTLDRATLTKLVIALHKYVQSMYTAARVHSEVLDGKAHLSQKEADPIVDYDHTQGWPTIEEFAS